MSFSHSYSDTETCVIQVALSFAAGKGSSWTLMLRGNHWSFSVSDGAEHSIDHPNPKLSFPLSICLFLDVFVCMYLSVCDLKGSLWSSLRVSTSRVELEEWMCLKRGERESGENDGNRWSRKLLFLYMSVVYLFEYPLHETENCLYPECRILLTVQSTF